MYNIHSLKEKLAQKRAKLAALELIEKNIEEFIERHGAEICGPDGIFGALSDEILLHIMSYLGPRELTNPPCMRFRNMVVDVLKILTRTICNDIPLVIYNNMIKYLFMYPICYYIYFYYHIHDEDELSYKYIKYEEGTCKNHRYDMNMRIDGFQLLKPKVYEILYVPNGASDIKLSYKFTLASIYITYYTKYEFKTYIHIYNGQYRRICTTWELQMLSNNNFYLQLGHAPWLKGPIKHMFEYLNNEANS
jgi:hypothetical protein